MRHASSLVETVLAAGALAKFTQLLVPKTLPSALFVQLFKQVVVKAKKAAGGKKK
jgi:hypothetical protein